MKIFFKIKIQESILGLKVLFYQKMNSQEVPESRVPQVNIFILISYIHLVSPPDQDNLVGIFLTVFQEA